MIVKVCGITNVEDALVAAGEGVTALGFVFYPRSPRYVDPARAADIISKLPPEIWKVGVFVNAAPETVAHLAEETGLDVVQLHGDESHADVPPGLRVWKAFRVDAGFKPERLEGWDVEAILLDSAAPGEYGGTGRPFHWKIAAGLKQRFILAGGLDADNVRDAIRQVHPWGVDASSRLESVPGKKDHAKMRAFIQAALSKRNHDFAT
jgi:phosphoribosylanthranilate isomerase